MFEELASRLAAVDNERSNVIETLRAELQALGLSADLLGRLESHQLAELANVVHHRTRIDLQDTDLQALRICLGSSTASIQLRERAQWIVENVILPAVPEPRHTVLERMASRTQAITPAPMPITAEQRVAMAERIE